LSLVGFCRLQPLARVGAAEAEECMVQGGEPACLPTFAGGPGRALVALKVLFL